MSTTTQSSKPGSSIAVKLRPPAPPGVPQTSSGRQATSADAPAGDQHIARQRPGWQRRRGVLVAAALLMGVAAGPVAPAQAAPGGDATIEETTLAPGTGQVATREGVATCPAGRRVVGGGIGTTADIVDSVVQASGPLDATGTTADSSDGEVAHSWYANVRNYGNVKTYKVFALCSATSDATLEETTMNLAPDERQGGVATCPAGRRVVGGGVGGTAATLGHDVRVSGPLDATGTTADTADGEVARSWYANVRNFNEPSTYRVFALCSATSDATIAQTTFSVAAGVPAGGVASCPAGRRVVGGGVGTTAATVDSEMQVSGPLDATGTTADGEVARSWYANVYNVSGAARAYKVFALCASDDLGAPAAGPTGGSGAGGPGAVTPGAGPNASSPGGGAGAGTGAVSCAGRRATIVGSARSDRLRGTRRRDVIVGLGGNDTIRGLGANDIICGGVGRDTLLGGSGADDLRGGSGNDTLRGEAGADFLRGEIGADRLFGGAGRDRLLGGPGRDRQTQ